MPPTLDYTVYFADICRWGSVLNLDGTCPSEAHVELARVAARRVAWAVATAWRKHMEVEASHALPAWLQAVLEAEAPD